MDVEVVVGVVVALVVLTGGGAALLLRGRDDGAPAIDDEMRDAVVEPQPQAPPPIAVEPDELEGVERPQATDLADPDLAATPPRVVEAPVEAPVEPGSPATAAPPTLTPAERFRTRLVRARNAFGVSVAGIFGKGVTEEAWEDLEEQLIAADVGVETTTQLVEGLRDRVRAEGVTTGEGALALLKEVLRLELSVADRSLGRRADGTTVWLVTGVNGTGKTTSIGKAAAKEVADGRTPVLAAADTYRAAASEQLQAWGERAGAQVVRGTEGADPASVAFDGWRTASSVGADLLIVDTAGRLQNKRVLMDELSKVKRVLERDAGPCDEVLLVLDATTGQNGLEQAKAFTEAVSVTGVVLTKLDGTSKGGIVLAIQRQLGVPVKLVGLGEHIDDLADFDPDAFVEALFAEVTADAPDEA